jgi:hypothetical protein
MLDALGSEALKERVEPGDGESDPARARPRRVRLDESQARSSISQSTSSPTRLSGGRPKNRVYQSMPTSRSDNPGDSPALVRGSKRECGQVGEVAAFSFTDSLSLLEPGIDERG